MTTTELEQRSCILHKVKNVYYLALCKKLCRTLTYRKRAALERLEPPTVGQALSFEADIMNKNKVSVRREVVVCYKER